MSVYQLRVHISNPTSDRSDIRDVVVEVTDSDGKVWTLQGPMLGGHDFIEAGLGDLVFIDGA